MFKKLSTYRFQISLALLVIFYSVGLGGILLSDQPIDFLSLTPLNLLISLFILLINHNDWKINQIFGLVTVALLGFIIEAIGVNTGLIFGSYSYGATLGFKLLDTPLMIGINWVMLTYCAVYWISNYIDNVLMIALASSLVLVVLDFLIEPVAIKYDFWCWQMDTIPLQNYLAWLVIAFLFSILINTSKKQSSNKIAVVLLACQFVFFGILNLLSWNI